MLQKVASLISSEGLLVQVRPPRLPNLTGCTMHSGTLGSRCNGDTLCCHCRRHCRRQCSEAEGRDPACCPRFPRACAEFAGAAAPQAFLRAGCVHLTFDSLHQQPPMFGWGQVAQALGPEVLANRTVLLQRGQSAALLVNGQQTASWDAEQAGGPAKLTARLQHVAPCCAVAGQPLQLLLSGFGLDAPGIKLHARHQGRFLPVQLASTEAEGVGPATAVRIELPAVPSPGLVWIEVEQQHLISRPQPLLVLPDAEMASELLLLEWALGPEVMAQVGWGVWVEEGEGLRCQLPCALLINAMFEGTRAEIAARSPHPSLTSARAHPTPLAGAAPSWPAAGPPSRVPPAAAAAPGGPPAPPAHGDGRQRHHRPRVWLLRLWQPSQRL